MKKLLIASLCLLLALSAAGCASNASSARPETQQPTPQTENPASQETPTSEPAPEEPQPETSAAPEAEQTLTVRVSWTEDEAFLARCLNTETLTQDAVRHLPVYRLDTMAELAQFREDFTDTLQLELAGSEGGSFYEATGVYDEGYLADHSILMAYVEAGSGSLRFALKELRVEGDTLTLVAEQTGTPEVGTADMAGWLILASVRDADLEGIAHFDAILEG